MTNSPQNLFPRFVVIYGILTPEYTLVMLYLVIIRGPLGPRDILQYTTLTDHTLLQSLD